MQKNSSGFSLIELLIAISIGSLVLIGAAQAFRTASNMISKTRQLSLENATLRTGVTQALQFNDYWTDVYNRIPEGGYGSMIYMAGQDGDGDGVVEDDGDLLSKGGSIGEDAFEPFGVMSLTTLRSRRPDPTINPDADPRNLHPGDSRTWFRGPPSGGWLHARRADEPGNSATSTGLAANHGFKRHWGDYISQWNNEKSLVPSLTEALQYDLGWYGMLDYLPDNQPLMVVKPDSNIAAFMERLRASSYVSQAAYSPVDVTSLLHERAVPFPVQRDNWNVGAKWSSHGQSNGRLTRYRHNYGGFAADTENFVVSQNSWLRLRDLSGVFTDHLHEFDMSSVSVGTYPDQWRIDKWETALNGYGDNAAKWDDAITKVAAHLNTWSDADYTANYGSLNGQWVNYESVSGVSGLRSRDCCPTNWGAWNGKNLYPDAARMRDLRTSANKDPNNTSEHWDNANGLWKMRENLNYFITGRDHAQAELNKELEKKNQWLLAQTMAQGGTIHTEVPVNWPRLYTIATRYKMRGKTYTTSEVITISPVTGEQLALSFSVPGTTLRGARQQWGLDQQ